MTKKIYFQAIGVWVILAILTVLFGAFREAFFIPVTGMDGTLARAILLPIALVYVYVVTYLFLKKSKADYKSIDTIWIGILWLILTLLFEFTFGTVVMGNSINALLTDYNLLKGRTWPLFLLFIAIAPYFLHRSLNDC